MTYKLEINFTGDLSQVDNLELALKKIIQLQELGVTFGRFEVQVHGKTYTNPSAALNALRQFAKVQEEAS